MCIELSDNENDAVSLLRRINYANEIRTANSQRTLATTGVYANARERAWDVSH